MTARTNKIRRIASKLGWIEIANQHKIRRISLSKESIRIDIYEDHAQMNVISWLYHPKKGLTKLVRNKVSFGLLKNIFRNPRFHTGKGYYRSCRKVTEICPRKAHKRNPEAQRKSEHLNSQGGQ